MGKFDTLLLEMSKDPSMIIWLDNQDNHNGAINENFGRELLELFSMGVGNYTEDDIKEASRAFTGWTLGNAEYMAMRASKDSIWPYGRIAWHFGYREDDHDEGDKTFLAEEGNLNGEDVVDAIGRNPATADFVARHMYDFFVADEPPVPQWPYTPPRDPAAIKVLTDAYFESGHEIKAMLRAMFNSDFFKAEDVRYARVKGPAELVIGAVRMSGDFQEPNRGHRAGRAALRIHGAEPARAPDGRGVARRESSGSTAAPWSSASTSCPASSATSASPASGT